MASRTSAGAGSTPDQSTGPTDPAAGLVARWSGDEGRFVNGIPNRDLVAADALDPDLLEQAFAAGTHRRPDDEE